MLQEQISIRKVSEVIVEQLNKRVETIYDIENNNDWYWENLRKESLFGVRTLFITKIYPTISDQFGELAVLTNFFTMISSVISWVGTLRSSLETSILTSVTSMGSGFELSCSFVGIFIIRVTPYLCNADFLILRNIDRILMTIFL